MSEAKKTKANVPPPRASFMGALPQAPTIAPSNMSAKLRDLNFKVDESFHREFKSTAANTGLSMKELFEESFLAWREKRGMS